MLDGSSKTKRIEKIQNELKARDISALICVKPENTFYLSDFNPIIYSHPVVAILPADGDLTILVHALRDDHIRASTFVRDVRLYGAWGTKKTMGPSWLSALKAILDEHGVASGRIGVEEDFLPIQKMRQFEELLPHASFADAADIIFKARVIKDASEIEAMRAACRVADAGMDAAIAVTAERGSEREIAVASMAAMNRLWIDEYPQYEVADFGSLEGGVHNGLWCWTLVGDRIAINADNPTDRRPQPGELVMSLIWTNCNGMHGENERTVAVGKLGEEQRRAYDAVLKIREAARSLIRPGTPIADLYNAAKAEYERLGYGAHLPGRIGHGMGLGAHEEPSLDGKSTMTLEPGMVMTFEPNLRVPPWGGLQHSDTVLITETGCEFLTKTDNGFLEV